MYLIATSPNTFPDYDRNTLMRIVEVIDDNSSEEEKRESSLATETSKQFILHLKGAHESDDDDETDSDTATDTNYNDDVDIYYHSFYNFFR